MKHPYGRRCIFINGPAGSGKDTAAYFIKKHFGSSDYKISRPLKAAMRELLDIHPDTWTKIMNSQELKAIAPHFCEHSYRELLVSFFKDWISPVLGEAYLGECAARYLEGVTNPSTLWTISDAGVADELVPIVHIFGHDNCALINLERPGHTFDNDCRSVVNGSDLDIACTTIVNKFDLELFEHQCVRAVVGFWPELGE